MRYPRNLKIFKGQIDTVPIMGLFFLLLIFLLLSALIYTPGIHIRLAPEEGRKVIRISRTGDILYDNQTYTVGTLEALRDELKKLPDQSALLVQQEPGAPKGLGVEVQKRTRHLNVAFETPGAGVELPEANHFSGTVNPRFVVAVSLGGQLFYENQVIQEAELRTQLELAVRRYKEPVTLLVRADKAVENGVIVKLQVLARDVGIKEMILATQPRTFAQPAPLLP